MGAYKITADEEVNESRRWVYDVDYSKLTPSHEETRALDFNDSNLGNNDLSLTYVWRKIKARRDALGITYSYKRSNWLADGAINK